MFSDLFKERYLESLGDYKHFYDDIAEYGNERTAGQIIYFVPGINGTPGQIRLLFPSLTKLFGPDIYVKCLNVPEFAATQPIWDKYSFANVDKKREQIVRDLKALTSKHDDVIILASSNGFYDLTAALSSWQDQAAKKKLKLCWGPCAPDWFIETVWEKLFFPMNGLAIGEYKWFAYPNHNLLKHLNPETTTHFKWRFGRQFKTLFKNDIESRFRVFDLYWDYISFGCFNAMLKHVLAKVTCKVDIPTRVLVPIDDGFWQGRSLSEVRAVLDKYLGNYEVIFKKASHLWVIAPENVTEMLAPFAAQKAASLATPADPTQGRASA